MSALSIRWRLTVWYTLAIVVILMVFGASLWWTQGRLGLRRADAELEGFSHTLANDISEELKEGDDLRLAADEARRTIVFNNDAVAVLDEMGRQLTADWHGLALDEPLPHGDDTHRVWDAETPSGTWRVHADSYRFEKGAFTLLVANDLADARRARHEVLEAMQIAIPLVLLLAGGGGFWLASIGVRPITDMAAQAARIAPGSGEELRHGERGDELGQLARAFNGLVARLRAALGTQQQFMADASHELRTPVSIMRMAADVTLSRERRDETDYREALTTVSDQAKRLGRLVDNMMVLARADAGGYPLRTTDLYLDEILTECVRALRPLTVERRVSIAHPPWPDMPFRGDEDLLRQLVLNILQNAVQHTPPDGTVTIDVEDAARDVRVRVRDTGPGIPAADRDRIFNRFVQLDPARRDSGAGLGLPIAKWIAEVHGGSVALEDSDARGSVFVITLPRLVQM